MVSNPQVDEIYASALSAGALGGKLSGAGGGGFLLCYVPFEKHPDVEKKRKIINDKRKKKLEKIEKRTLILL